MRLRFGINSGVRAAVLLAVGILCGCASDEPDATRWNPFAEFEPLSGSERQALTARADSGDLEAMHTLARRALRVGGPLYFPGSWGDVNESQRWWRRAAALGDTKAMIALGHMYAEPWGVPQDLSEAANWFKQVAEMNRLDGMQELVRLYLGEWSDERDEAAAAIWMEKAAAVGDRQSTRLLGLRYDAGWGVPADAAAAAAWYEKVLASEGMALRDRIVALNNLGALYEQGRGVAKDEAKAAELYRAASELSSIRGTYNLAVLCEAGRGVPQDKVAALWLYRRAANYNQVSDAADALKRLGFTPQSTDGEGAAVAAHAKEQTAKTACNPGVGGDVLVTVAAANASPAETQASLEAISAVEAGLMSAPVPPPKAPLKEGYPAHVEGLTYRDEATNVTIHVEMDGRHVTATSPDGTLLWRKNPFVDAKLQPYRSARPTIDHVGPAGDEFRVGDSSNKVFGVRFTSSQFGVMDIVTGQFRYLGQD